MLKSKGPVVQPYFKSYEVYGVSFSSSPILLVALVELLHFYPVLTLALTIITTAVISYLGNSRFTFKQ